jgi:hypothetical protein
MIPIKDDNAIRSRGYACRMCLVLIHLTLARLIWTMTQMKIDVLGSVLHTVLSTTIKHKNYSTRSLPTITGIFSILTMRSSRYLEGTWKLKLYISYRIVL